jgi:hypothetical protein
VVILAGTDDVAGNTGPSMLEMVEANLMAMIEIVKQQIRVVPSSVLPACDYPWKPCLKPASKVSALSAWMRRYAGQVGETYHDCHSAMGDARGDLPAAFAGDGCIRTIRGIASWRRSPRPRSRGRSASGELNRWMRT